MALVYGWRQHRWRIGGVASESSRRKKVVCAGSGENQHDMPSSALSSLLLARLAYRAATELLVNSKKNARQTSRVRRGSDKAGAVFAPRALENLGGGAWQTEKQTTADGTKTAAGMTGNERK